MKVTPSPFGAYLFSSAITIHMMPNLSVTMPNLDAKKVLVSGCRT